MKNILAFFFKLILLFFVISIVILGVYKNVIKNPFKLSDETIIITATSKTFSGVMAENADKFKIKELIKVYNKLNRVSITVKKGVYEFPKGITLPEVIESLEKGKYNTSIVKVTIPEGYTIEQIGAVLEDKDIVSKSKFIEGCQNYKLPEYINKNYKKRYDLEGFLFPDTYYFEKDMSTDDIISIMIKRFEDIVDEIEDENNLKIDYKDYEQMVVKASIIEREVSKTSEKALVSSVIDNRLKINMKLQIDATVLYALGEHKDKIYLSDLKYKSPYNTYYIEGLPIGAISNPGKESLKAAILPEKTNYIYYMTKDGINHKFFEKYSEFLKYKNSK